MEKEQKLKLQTEFRIKDNIQFLFIDNYIISVKKAQTNVYEFHFYNTKNFEKEFIIKNENEENLDYKNFELFHIKNKDLYLIGYFRNERFESGINIMKIVDKKIEKRASYNYDCFMVDLQDDKIYIINDASFIIYDILNNTSIEINDIIVKEYDEYDVRLNYECSSGKQLFLVDNYFLFTYTREYTYIYKYYGLHYQIINKNSYTNESEYEDFSLLFDDNCDYNFEFNEDFKDASDHFFFKWKYGSQFFLYQISKNLFYITIGDSEEAKLYFVEINNTNNINKKYNNLYQIEKKDKIVDKNPIYPIDNEKFCLKSLANIYIYKISGFELIFKFQLNYPYPSMHLIKFQDKNEKNKIILADKERVLFLTS